MSDHDDIRHKLPAFAAALLSEPATVAVEAHLETCSECRDAVAALAPDTPGPGVELGHIPAGVLARWPRASRELRGLERELVASHLEACEDCRAALAVLGYPPVLAEQEVSSVLRDAAQSGGGRHWALWSWAALSTAAAFVLALAQWSPSRLPKTGASNGEVPEPITIAVPEPKVAREPVSMARVGTRVDIKSPRRDGGPGITILRRAPGSWTPVFTPLLSAPADSVNVELLDPARTAVVKLALSGTALVSDGLLLDTASLLPGDYTLRVWWRNDDGSAGSRDYPLRVER